MKPFAWLLSFSLFTPAQLSGQGSNLGIPFVQNYDKEQYGAATQNWDLAQDRQGRMYAANNDGLLSYNGRYWSLFPLPNRTIARSLAIHPQQGQIYVGGQDELGFFLPDERGILQFQSLQHRLPDDYRHFEDVWDLVLMGDTLWMRTSQQICWISANGSEGSRPVGEYGFLGSAGGQLYAFDTGKGLFRWENQAWTFLQGSEALRGTVVTGVISKGRSCWIGTVRHGLWQLSSEGIVSPLTIPASNFLLQQRIHAMKALANGTIAVGTARRGLMLLDTLGRPLHWLYRGNGLQNNHLLSLYDDAEGNLWLGLNNGIDYVEIASPFYRILPDPEQEGAGHAITRHQDTWWMGTANGLFYQPASSYHSPLNPLPYQLQYGSEGQVWGLSLLDQDLFMGHHEGSFEVMPPLKPVEQANGTWKFVSLSAFPDYRFAGTYEGITILKKEGERWIPWRKVPGLTESSRLLASDGSDKIWMAHPYRGVYRIDFSKGLEEPEVKRFGQQHGLPYDNFNHVFSVMGKVWIGTVNGVYAYSDSLESFRPALEFDQAMGKKGWIRLMQEDAEGNVWFVMDDDPGILQVVDEGLERKIVCRWLPELSDHLVKGHEFIAPIDKDHVFFGVDNGFVRYAPSQERPPSVSSLLLAGVWLQENTDSLVAGSHLNPASATNPLAFSYLQNTFRFELSVTRYQRSKHMEFRYYLEGIESGWLPWTTKAEKEYTQLPPGKYTFHAQSRDEHGQLSEPIGFAFTIMPPWYASQTAQVVYVLLVLLFLGGLLLIPQRMFNEERKRLQLDLQEQEAARKKEVMALKNQSLQAEIQFKNRELASSTMHLVQKNEILTRLRAELERLTQELKDPEPKTRLRQLLGMVNQDEQLDKDWEHFSYHFDQVHADFLKRLSEDFPQLTPKDHRLCAYLRMNLSTKEIAPLMNISVRGVEISRYRLRKKLGLDHEDNLLEFMMRY